MKQARRFPYRPDIRTIGRAADEEVIAAIRTPDTAAL